MNGLNASVVTANQHGLDKLSAAVWGCRLTSSCRMKSNTAVSSCCKWSLSPASRGTTCSKHSAAVSLETHTQHRHTASRVAATIVHRTCEIVVCALHLHNPVPRQHCSKLAAILHRYRLVGCAHTHTPTAAAATGVQVGCWRCGWQRPAASLAFHKSVAAEHPQRSTLLGVAVMQTVLPPCLHAYTPALVTHTRHTVCHAPVPCTVSTLQRFTPAAAAAMSRLKRSSRSCPRQHGRGG